MRCPLCGQYQGSLKELIMHLERKPHGFNMDNCCADGDWHGSSYENLAAHYEEAAHSITEVITRALLSQ